VRSDSVFDASAYAPVPLSPNPCWVEAGEPLPPGADAVLAPDAVAMTGQAAEAIAPANPGDGVLGAGAEAVPERPLRRAGERMRQIDVAAMRAAGLSELWVREPRLCLYAANPATEADDDTVAPLLARCIEVAGAVVRIERSSKGGPMLNDALCDDRHDAVVVIGGTGSGRRDASVSTLAAVGRVDIHGMGIRPGETAALGSVGSRPVLLLPGRLDAALAVWLLVGRRLLARLSGAHDSEPAIKATVVRKVVSTIGLAEVVPVGSCDGGVEPLASAYFPLQTLTRSAGWIFVPPESEGLPAGASAEVRPFP
jgi:molybdopterin biosynthesis enzyme